jgi:phosphoadenosine phosphosulfate reductase
MLLHSSRHTRRDLDYWRELESADAEHFIHPSKIERAMRRVHEFEKERCYMATSWGKDSLVAAHLTWLVSSRVPFVFIKQEGLGEDPYQIDVQSAFERLTGITTDVVRVRLSAFTKGRSPALEQGIKIAQAKYGVRYINGLRAEESTVRKMAFFGGRSEDSCWVIGDWTVQDIFAYIAQNNLPCHPAYAMTGGGRYERAHIRVSTIGGHKGRGAGRDEWEKEYYSDVLARIKSGNVST